jgi:hypothetical protein
MWDPRRLTTLWATTACYTDSFTFLPLRLLLIFGWYPVETGFRLIKVPFQTGFLSNDLA